MRRVSVNHGTIPPLKEVKAQALKDRAMRREGNEEEVNSAAQEAAKRAADFINGQVSTPKNTNHLKDIPEEDMDIKPVEVDAPSIKASPASFNDLLNIGKPRNNRVSAGSNNPFPDQGMRIGLPSNMLFNEVKDVFAKPLEFPQLCLMHTAKLRGDDAMFVDILNDTISCDIRDLCYADYRTFLYWQRLHSFVTIPYTFTWRSRYGNDNTYELKNSNIEIIQLEADDPELEFPEFTLPTVRIVEEYQLNIKDMERSGIDTASYSMLVQKAQYFKGPYLDDRIAAASKADMDTLYVKLPKFIKKYANIGVVEQFTATDSLFDSTKALEYIDLQREGISRILEDMLEGSAPNSDEIAEPISILDELTAEYERITSEIEKTGEAAPSSETRNFSIGIADFFPHILV